MDQAGKKTVGSAKGQPGSAALSRELSDFLIELSIAIHKHAMYPGDHPSLGPAADSVANRLLGLLETRPQLAMGVARKQLVIEGVATDSHNPVLTDLATRLHAHHLGAVSFNKGASPFEVQSFLRMVAVDPERTGEPLGLGPSSRRNAIPHVRMYPVAYDRLQLLDEEQGEVEKDPTKEHRAAKTRSAQLWVGLARAAMAIEALAGEDEEVDADIQAEPSIVARAISDHPRDSAYDQVIVGYLLQIADEIKSAGGKDALQLRNRVTKLVSHLEGSTLRKLLEMGGDGGQRRKFMMDASQGMAVDAVIKLAHAAAESQEQSISHSMLRILEKLAHHAEVGQEARRQVADQSVRDHITELIGEWSLLDPNPDEYTMALQRMARSSPMFRVSSESVYRPEPKRMVQMALEVNVSGPAVLNAAQTLVNNRQFQWLSETLQDVKAPEVEYAIWLDIATVDRLVAVLGEEQLDIDLVDGIIARIGTAAAEPMIESLTEAESRQTRRVLLDRLVAFGPVVAPLAVARLADSRWYVQRNMLAIIGELEEIPEGFHADDFFRHPDERVRREAFRIMFESRELRERAISRAVADADPRNARMGLTAALDNCPKAAIPLIVSRATGDSPPEIKEAAIRVLGRLDEPFARDVLFGMAQPKRGLFGIKLPPKSPEYLASLRALQRHRQDPRAAMALHAASRSKDPEIVQAATVAAEDAAHE